MGLRAVVHDRDTETFSNPTFTGNITGAAKVLVVSAVPFIHVSSGSIGNNGALSAITALPRTFADGAYVYYPANAIAAGVAAGWYWTVFSSTTAGTIYNSTYTSGTPVRGTTTAFATTGPGAFTGDIAERAAPTITLSGGSMGAYGALEIFSYWATNTAAGNKIPRIRLGGGAGTAYLQQTLTTALTGIAYERVIANNGAQDRQVGQYADGNIYAGNTTATVTSSVDTSADTTIVFSLEKATATNFLILEQLAIKVVYRAS